MNIFYTEVDANLKKELDARGRAGFYDRSKRAIDFMVGKIANVLIQAYDQNDSAGAVVGVLGGGQLRSGRWMPNGKDGYLTDSKVEQTELNFWTEQDLLGNPKQNDIIVGNAYLKNSSTVDTSKRTGPYITAVDINIGDHSMGLLNKATVQFTIPNISRDLDIVEQTWFRPGRYISIDIEHPDSALVSANGNTMESVLAGLATNGLLTPQTIPNREKLEKLYPSWKKEMDKFVRQMSRMNAVRFEGLVTQFDFQFTQDGTITATLSITGTSNVYTDISMLIDSDKAKTEDAPKPVSPEDIATITGSREDFYEILYKRADVLRSELFTKILGLDRGAEYIIPYSNKDGDNPPNTDRFILFGEPYKPTHPTNLVAATPSPPESLYARYITFGGLIHYINNYVLTKIQGSVTAPEITFSDTACYSNYYDGLVSADPDNILLLPGKTAVVSSAVKNTIPTPDCNTYGDLVYYANVNNNLGTYTVNNLNLPKWPGCYDKVGSAGKYYPSRIFINFTLIQDTINNLTNKGKEKFSVSTFISVMCGYIHNSTGGAIDLKLVSHPLFTTKLMLMDHNFVDGGKINETQKVVPYSMPMFSNHPNGSVVRDFSFSAKLPESAKNLSYVLNSTDDVTELDIAPYMNFMYNAQNKDQINKLQQKYRTAHDNIIQRLAEARIKFGESPSIDELQASLQKALAEYVKKPFPDFRKTSQMTAPIFPFDASVTLDGIHGFKYGDVLQFDALPLRYRMNTVFSIINISHTVNGNGEWITTLKCIMRPSID